MSDRRWRYALASALGTSHLASGDPCQDRCSCELVTDGQGGSVLLAVAADGAGSAKFSDRGAEAACRTAVEWLRHYLGGGGRVDELTRGAVIDMVASIRGELRSLALGAGSRPRDFACTLLVAVVARDVAAFCQVGDGAVVVAPRHDDGFSWVFWPERGEYANTTSFVSDDDVADHLMHDIVPGPVDEVALLTDGIQSLVLDYKARVAHSPFFERAMRPLRAAEVEGLSAGLSLALGSYLDSAPVNERTDDDKTLILASRRSQHD